MNKVFSPDEATDTLGFNLLKVIELVSGQKKIKNRAFILPFLYKFYHWATLQNYSS